MRLMLGMIVRNEAPILRLTLPVYSGAEAFKLALDFGSTDGTVDILRKYGWQVEQDAWRNDYAWARNRLLELAKHYDVGADWMLQLDADECMTLDDIRRANDCCETVESDAIAFPRYNYVRGGEYEDGSYPDWQTRCIRINSERRFSLAVHEIFDGPRSVCWAHIHHFGWTKSPQENWLRSHNYRLIAEGKPTITAADIPSDIRRITYDDWLINMRTRHSFSPVRWDHPLKGVL